jgi:DNA-binding GntR family transcriptional regulator
LSRSEPLYELIYKVLRQHLTDGRFPDGLVVDAANVARAFKASRVPAGAALKRLLDERLLAEFGGRGYLANPSGKDVAPVRLDLFDAGLRLPPALQSKLTQRNLRDHIYPEIEHAIAACLAYGRFILNESALADHYRVSRTVAHEVLTTLQRSGIISQDQNQRWYAGPLTEDDIRQHFEIRWLLEPVALRQAFSKLSAPDLERRRERAAGIQDGREPRLTLELIEQDLHVDSIAPCDNVALFDAVRRSQRLILVTHSTFEHYQHPEEIVTMAAEHLAIYDHLLAGQGDRAAAALEAHLRRAMWPNLEIRRRLGPLADEKRPPYLLPANQK